VALYKKWCDATKEEEKRKRYWTYVEKAGGRDEIRDDLTETMRSHYDRLERIAEDVARLGYKVAADILRAELPQSAKVRSGDLGEILATELVEEEIGLWALSADCLLNGAQRDCVSARARAMMPLAAPTPSAWMRTIWVTPRHSR
jgi:hypothetical protein